MIKLICPICGNDNIKDNGYNENEVHLLCIDYGHQFKIKLRKEYWECVLED